ncbi:amidohydrolase family protein [Roseateles oligotrophus]|uniref:Amidohydrolase family protein n=1 Tax=Roseateles oligotrophus TaxID=1769250 RepID=A0ABT2YLM0_9BURK|nr:amidohydrolase family protein [Roseateles oligotrophus]MCV2370967.1 amidohydrolase family protein [Roseateles oligotrophus]
MRLRFQFFHLFVCWALCWLSPAKAEPDSPALTAGPPLSMELKNAQWFDGKGFVKRGTLYVKDGKFSKEKIKKPQRSLDLSGQFLIPPLAEAHNHNLQNGWGYARYANSYLRDGVFYAAMHCGEPQGVALARGLANQPAAPDLLFVSACITSSDGQPLAQLLGAESGSGPKPKLEDVADKLVLIMDSPEQVAQKWPLMGPRKTDLLKLMLSRSESPELHGDAKQQGRLGLKPEVVPAIVKRAHQDGLRVIAHVETAGDFALALQSGVDWIDHLPGYFFHEGLGAEAYRISPEIAAEAAKKRVAVITATAAATLFRSPPEAQAALRRLQIENLLTLKSAGVKLLIGSDVFNGGVLNELRHLDGLGVLDRATLLRLATIATPQTLYPKRRLGCFEPGCEASFLLLAANPLNELETLGKIQLRVKQGRILGLQSP